MVGSALVRRLLSAGHCVVTAERNVIDLRDQSSVRRFLEFRRPNVVIVAAARVGGILANDTYPASFLYDNLMISANIIESAFRAKVEKLLYLGSSCVYPRSAPQPIEEKTLLTGPLEPTNQWYAVAKIAGIKLCQAFRRQHGCDFISCQPTNLYGPHDNFDLTSSHVLPALLRKAHEAKETGAGQMVVWGTGRPRREFLHVDDLADACIHLVERYSDEEPINIGTGQDISIAELADLVATIVGFGGELAFDQSKPDGAPRKLLDTARMRALGWSPLISLPAGIKRYYEWYRNNVAHDGRL
jgi:GDP-L-fucose synthase